MDLQSLFDSKTAISIISAIAGGVLTRIFTVIRGRVQELEYTVKHDRVGLSVDDAIFGSVKAMWQGRELTNLYSSTLTISNTTARDFKGLVIKVYTGDTELLNERVEIKGSTYLPKHTQAFKDATHVEPGSQPSEWQMNFYRRNREYDVVALNRGQQVIFQYLTTQPNQNGSPSVWAEIQQEGLRAAYKPPVAELRGVPVKHAMLTGLVAGVGLLVCISYAGPPIWLASTLMLLIGFVAPIIGAWVYRSVRATVRFLTQ